MISKIRKQVWNITSKLYPFFLRKIYGMDISMCAVISHKAKLDKSINPKGVHIGDYSWVLANSTILAHDHSRNLKVDTFIGKNCIIGINSIIMPGIRIGDHVVVGSGAVVTKDVANNCIVAGNPAKVIREGIFIDNLGRII